MGPQRTCRWVCCNVEWRWACDAPFLVYQRVPEPPSSHASSPLAWPFYLVQRIPRGGPKFLGCTERDLTSLQGLPILRSLDSGGGLCNPPAKGSVCTQWPTLIPQKPGPPAPSSPSLSPPSRLLANLTFPRSLGETADSVTWIEVTSPAVAKVEPQVELVEAGGITH